MTKNVIFDSFALIAHFRNEEGAEYISSLLADLAVGDKDGFMSLANVGEIHYMLYRKSGR